MSPTIGLIIFDCDGVLVDSEVLAVKALKQVLDEVGVPATEAMIGQCFGMKQADILARIARETGVAIPPTSLRGSGRRHGPGSNVR